MLIKCWANVADYGLTLDQHWVNVPYCAHSDLTQLLPHLDPCRLSTHRCRSGQPRSHSLHIDVVQVECPAL